MWCFLDLPKGRVSLLPSSFSRLFHKILSASWYLKLNGSNSSAYRFGAIIKNRRSSLPSSVCAFYLLTLILCLLPHYLLKLSSKKLFVPQPLLWRCLVHTTSHYWTKWKKPQKSTHQSLLLGTLSLKSEFYHCLNITEPHLIWNYSSNTFREGQIS